MLHSLKSNNDERINDCNIEALTGLSLDADSRRDLEICWTENVRKFSIDLISFDYSSFSQFKLVFPKSNRLLRSLLEIPQERNLIVHCGASKSTTNQRWIEIQ